MVTVNKRFKIRTKFLVLLVAVLVWAVLIEPRWVAKREIEVSQLHSEELRGLKAVLTSDWHFTKRPLWRVMTVERAKEIVEKINATKPDVIILAGDYIADSNYQPEANSSAAEEITAVLGKLNAKYGVYAVLGNHDWWFNGEQFTQAFQWHGIVVLENNAIKIKGKNLWIAGIGDGLTGHDGPSATLRNIPSLAPAIITMHDPGTLLRLPADWQNPNALFLTGHTHGGQVYLPFIGALIVPATAPRLWAYGWIQHNHHQMYVTSGLGVSILPIRFNMRPEWVTFTLH